MKHHLFFSFFKGALVIMQFLCTTLGSRKLFLVTEHIVRSYLCKHSVCEIVAEHQYDMLRRQVPSINDVRGHSTTTLLRSGSEWPFGQASSGSLLEGRAEISVIFGWYFGRNDDLINSF